MTLGSGDSIEDYGSLYSDGDVDWWYVEVNDDPDSIRNISFQIVLSVPSLDGSTPAGTWEVTPWVSTPEESVPAVRTALPAGVYCNAVSATCALTWSVVGLTRTTHEYYWSVRVSAPDWDARMCTESPSDSTYAITVTR